MDTEVPFGSRVRTEGQSIRLISTSDATDATWVTWRLDDSVLPAGLGIDTVATAICGAGEGDFWEVYGPSGSYPEEYEVAVPEADGCWHFTGAPGDDLTVIAGVLLDSELIITRVIFEITFAD